MSDKHRGNPFLAESGRTYSTREGLVNFAPSSLREMEWRERDGVRWLEAELPGARAAFSTRLGGVSTSPYEELNVAVLTGDEPDRVRENRRRLAGALARDAEG